MARARVINDHSMALGKVLLGIVAPNYREEEHRDVFAEFYQACRAAFEHYSDELERENRRLKPSRN